MVKNPPANAGDARDLGQEDPLEKEMTTHYSILAQKNPHGQKSLVGYSPWVPKESFTFQTEEGRGGRREMIGEEEET